jgi:hypothetical protein
MRITINFSGRDKRARPHLDTYSQYFAVRALIGARTSPLLLAWQSEARARVPLGSERRLPPAHPSTSVAFCADAVGDEGKVSTLTDVACVAFCASASFRSTSRFCGRLVSFVRQLLRDFACSGEFLRTMERLDDARQNQEI